VGEFGLQLQKLAGTFPGRFPRLEISLNGSLAFLGDQEKCQIKALRRAAHSGSLLLDLKNDVHNCVWQVGFRGRSKVSKTWFWWQTSEPAEWQVAMREKFRRR